jgi:hypothetical protein
MDNPIPYLAVSIYLGYTCFNKIDKAKEIIFEGRPEEYEPYLWENKTRFDKGLLSIEKLVVFLLTFNLLVNAFNLFPAKIGIITVSFRLLWLCQCVFCLLEIALFVNLKLKCCEPLNWARKKDIKK